MFNLIYIGQLINSFYMNETYNMNKTYKINGTYYCDKDNERFSCMFRNNIMNIDITGPISFSCDNKLKYNHNQDNSIIISNYNECFDDLISEINMNYNINNDQIEVLVKALDIEHTCIMSKY